MKKIKYDRSVKKPFLQLVMDAEKAYLIVNFKKHSHYYRKGKNFHTPPPIKSEKPPNSLHTPKSQSSPNKWGVFRKANLPTQPLTNAIQCNYDKQLQKENIILKKQNKFLYDYIRIQEEEKINEQRNRRVKRNIFGFTKELEGDEEEKLFRFTDTLTSTRY